jgi:glucose-1-phosphate adenylyltransferase
LFEDIKNRVVQDVVILSGDHLYRMDYLKFVEQHRSMGADITIGCLPVDYERASDFGLMKIDDSGQIRDFAEKPKGADLDAMKVDTTVLGLDKTEAKEKPFIASMGIYVFKKDVLVNLLKSDELCKTANDFGGEIIPLAARKHRVMAYLFNDYWEDIGTIKSFFEANLALAQQPPRFEFYDPQTPIYTSPRFLPPAKLVKCKISDAIISHGSYLEECVVENAIIGLRSRVDKNVIIRDAMVMGADYYESDEQREALFRGGRVPIGIGANSVISNTIVDKNARIGQNCTIVNKEGIEEANREDEGFYIRSGIVTVLRNAEIKDGTEL